MSIRASRAAFLAVTLTLLATLFAPAAKAASSATIPVTLDGLPVEFDVPPTIVGGRALVPFRLLAEALGCDVTWDGATRHVHATAPWSERTADLFIGRTDAQVSGQGRTLDVPPMIVDGRTLIPLRFFAEAFGAEVAWHDDTRSITVASPVRPMEVLGYYALGNAETSSWTEVFGQPYPGLGVGSTDLVSTAACAWFVLDASTGGIVLDDRYSGQKRPDEWREIVDRLGDYAIQADMMVHWARTDAAGVADPSIYAFLRSPAAMRRAVDEMASYAADFHGVNLDIEYLGQRQTGDELDATKRDFNTFVQLLSSTLHGQGKTLTLSLHPLNTWYPGYDWATLGNYADRIVIMAYGYGPLASPQPFEKVTEAVDLALRVVPAEKLLLGLVATKSNGVEGGETRETLAPKVGLAKRRGLAGVALWRLGVWGPEKLGAIRKLVSRPPAAEVIYGYGQPDQATVDTAATPPLKVAGTYYVPLLPVAGALGIPVRWDEAAGQAVLVMRPYGYWEEVVAPVPSDEPGFDPAAAPEAILVRGMTYLRVDYAVSLLGQFAPEDVSYSVELTWDPNAATGPRLTLLRVPRIS